MLKLNLLCVVFRTTLCTPLYSTPLYRPHVDTAYPLTSPSHCKQPLRKYFYFVRRSSAVPVQSEQHTIYQAQSSPRSRRQTITLPTSPPIFHTQTHRPNKTPLPRVNHRIHPLLLRPPVRDNPSSPFRRLASTPTVPTPTPRQALLAAGMTGLTRGWTYLRRAMPRGLTRLGRRCCARGSTRTWPPRT